MRSLSYLIDPNSIIPVTLLQLFKLSEKFISMTIIFVYYKYIINSDYISIFAENKKLFYSLLLRALFE